MTSFRLGIIGSGNIGAGVARMAATSRIPVIIANSRGPASLGDLITELADLPGDVSAGSVTEAARDSDIIVLAVPITAYASFPADALRGKVVIDAMNYYPELMGVVQALEEQPLTSSEFLQRVWPEARLVKALNNVDFVRLPQLPRSAGSAERSALPLAGDDVEARRQVADLLEKIGFDALDLGPLSEGWRFEPGAPLYVSPYSRDIEPLSDDPAQRFMTAEAVTVSLETATALAAQAARN